MPAEKNSFLYKDLRHLDSLFQNFVRVRTQDTLLQHACVQTDI
jgi:hypothetical protein